MEQRDADEWAMLVHTSLKLRSAFFKVSKVAAPSSASRGFWGKPRHSRGQGPARW